MTPKQAAKAVPYIEDIARISMSYRIAWRQSRRAQTQALGVACLASVSYAAAILAVVEALTISWAAGLVAVAFYIVTAFANWYFTQTLLLDDAWERDPEALQLAAADPINRTTLGIQGAIGLIAIGVVFVVLGMSR